MSSLQDYMPVAQKAANVIEYMMIEELGLVPPEKYELTGKDGRVYLVASFNPLDLGPALKPYENPDVARRLSRSLADLPVAITKRTGTRYVVLLTGRLKLPKSVNFPTGGMTPDMFRLGVGLKGEIHVKAQRLLNVIIGAGQGKGKSNIEKLFAYQARQFGWQLFLADPDGHTFNPDAWNSIAAAPVASSPNDLLILLERVAAELADRVVSFRSVANGGIPPADLDLYNAVAAQHLPRIGLIIDEANSYLGDKKIFSRLADLLRRGRKWGLHIFLAGHEWHKEVVDSEINDMLQTRIGLAVTTDQMGQVILRDRRWGNWLMGKAAGRGVLKVNEYQPVQFYQVTEEQEQEWLSSAIAPSPLSEDEKLIVQRSLDDADGKMTIDLLMGWGMGQREARRLVEDWELRGWLERDASQGNARVVTPKLANLLTKRQTRQSRQTA